MTPIDFSNLEKYSQSINEGSDRVSQTLLEIQEKLNSLNLGVEVWLESDTGSFLSEATAQDGWVKVVWLGYGKDATSGKWGLLVQEVCQRWREDEDSWEAEVQTPRSSLLDASRNLRIKALDCIPALITQLEGQAKSLVETVSSAKDSADKL